MLAQPEAGPWIIGQQTVLVGDCLAHLAQIPPQSVDVVVTSPPYNIGTRYQSYRDQLPRAGYLDWLSQLGCHIHQVMKPAGSFFLNVGQTSTDPWLAMDVAHAFRDQFVLQNTIAWIKSVSVGTDTVGHFKPISSPRFLNNNHETVFHFTKTGSVLIDRLAIGVPFKDKSNIQRRGHLVDRRCAGNVWVIPYRTVRSKAQKFDHPAGFPLGLPLRCIKLHGIQGATVLDPLMGAGTTLVAAEALNCPGIGIEMDPGYAEKAVERLRALRHKITDAVG